MIPEITVTGLKKQDVLSENPDSFDEVAKNRQWIKSVDLSADAGPEKIRKD